MLSKNHLISITKDIFNTQHLGNSKGCRSSVPHTGQNQIYIPYYKLRYHTHQSTILKVLEWEGVSSFKNCPALLRLSPSPPQCNMRKQKWGIGRVKQERWKSYNRDECASWLLICDCCSSCGTFWEALWNASWPICLGDGRGNNSSINPFTHSHFWFWVESCRCPMLQHQRIPGHELSGHDKAPKRDCNCMKMIKAPVGLVSATGTRERSQAEEN